MTHHGEVVRGTVAARAGLLFFELHVQAPVHAVFDFPVAAHRAGSLVGLGRQGADAVLTLDALVAPQLASALDQKRSRTTRPTVPVSLPMASMIAMVAASASAASNSGMPVLSLDFSSAARWPGTRAMPATNALTMCSAAAFFPSVRRLVLPATANTLPGASMGTTTPTQRRKAVSNACASSSRNTRTKVPCEATPAPSVRKRRSHSSLERPYSALSTKSSAPHHTAHTATASNSDRLCRIWRALRESGTETKISFNSGTCPVCMARP